MKYRFDSSFVYCFDENSPHATIYTFEYHASNDSYICIWDKIGNIGIGKEFYFDEFDEFLKNINFMDNLTLKRRPLLF